MVLACRRDHRFAKLKKFDVKQLARETLVGFDMELVIWKKIDRFLKDHGVEANVMMRFDNIEAIKRAVEAGSGVALLPRPTLEGELELGTPEPASTARLIASMLSKRIITFASTPWSLRKRSIFFQITNSVSKP